MSRKRIRWTAAVAFFAAAALGGGCGDNKETTPTDISGQWTGALTLSYIGALPDSGTLALSLDQTEDFASGWATWEPVRDTQSINGPIDGRSFSLRLHFSCENGTEVTILSGAFDKSTLTFSGASGRACVRGGSGDTVNGAAGTLRRTTDDKPL